MPLPKISTPTYELEIPSTGKKIKYRPFLVREEKILIMALESEDIKQISNAIVQILSECIQTRAVKVKDLSTFDIEYLFLNIRAKSVGETVEVNITCPDDGETTVQMEIDIDSIKVQKDKNHKDKDVKIGDEVWVGGNVIILSGVSIGNGAIIGAGSVVSKDIKPYSINVGNPCKEIGMRFSEKDIERHEAIISNN